MGFINDELRLKVDERRSERDVENETKSESFRSRENLDLIARKIGEAVQKSFVHKFGEPVSQVHLAGGLGDSVLLDQDVLNDKDRCEAELLAVIKEHEPYAQTVNLAFHPGSYGDGIDPSSSITVKFEPPLR